MTVAAQRHDAAGIGTHPTASPLSDDALMAPFFAKPGFLLARIDQICTALFGGISTGETLAQAEFLMLIEALGPVPQIALARAAGVDKSTTAYIVDNLEGRGWIEREACRDDRRRLLVSLAPEGRARMARVRSDYATLQRRFEAPLDAADRPALAAMLHRLGANPDSPAPPWIPACHPALGVLDGALSFLTRRALQLFQAQFLVGTPGLNLTLRQFSLLFILSKRDTLTQTAFARLFGLDPSTCAVIMRGLVSRGLISAAPSQQDRRERVYRITPQGLSVLTELQPIADGTQDPVFGDATPAQIDWLVDQLRRLVRAHSHILRFPGAIGDL